MQKYSEFHFAQDLRFFRDSERFVLDSSWCRTPAPVFLKAPATVNPGKLWVMDRILQEVSDERVAPN